ncbi:uncharacterized protein ABDE67_012947 [Symphorus nematophorus]
MGNGLSKEEREKEKKEKTEDFQKRLSDGPNLRVSDGIKRFTGLDSSDNLRQHYETRKMEAGGRCAELIKSLVEKLGGLTPSPELAGLGALAIAVLIDIISSSPPESTKDALRSVFAEEKASEVWDQIDECLKRYRMNIKSRPELVSDMKRIESQLSTALTKLKNSMVRDGHMSSEALRAWVNGAAFHIQMLIQLVRLGGIQTCDPIEELLSIYKNDLDPLFEKHQEMIKGKCRETGTVIYGVVQSRFLVDEESECHSMDIYGNFDTYFEAYYDHRYCRQKREIQEYFSDVGQKLQELVRQRGSLNVY